tara:strand:- start:690 stop:1226 length:537 start_codon:yes stop_codon:yes gene_type:complete
MRATEDLYELSNSLHEQGVKREDIALNVLGYTIDDQGVVRNRFNNIIGSKDKYSYQKFQITLSGKCIVIFSHRLQAFKKYGYKLYEKGIMVRHKDDVKSNNTVNNILIGTAKDNYDDRGKEAISISQKKATEASKKYSNELVKEIKQFYRNNNNPQTLTMNKYNISNSSTLWYIINKR